MDRVIVLGVDTPIGLAVVRDLGRAGFEVTGFGSRRNALGLASRYCHRRRVREPQEERLVAQLLFEAADVERCFLIAVSEANINLVNRHRELLDERLVLLVPPAAQMAKVLDKQVTLAAARRVGISTPVSHSVDPQRELAPQLEAIRYPVVLKWAAPHRVSDRLASAGQPLRKLQYCQTAGALERALAAYAGIGEYPLVQEYCPGRGLGQFFLCQEGEALLRFQHERINEWPPEGGTSTLCRSLPLTWHRDCLARSEALLRELAWTGVAMVEYRYHEATGDYWLMEINGRFWGSLPLAEAAGMHFAADCVRAIGRGEEVVQREYPSLRCRYLLPDTKRLLRVLFRAAAIADPAVRFSRWRAVSSYLLRFLDPGCRYFVLQLSDPRPWLVDFLNVSGKLLRRQ
jgi:predicted ATP-grasp superfamily ATP-dependent carboligase